MKLRGAMIGTSNCRYLEIQVRLYALFSIIYILYSKCGNLKWYRGNTVLSSNLYLTITWTIGLFNLDYCNALLCGWGQPRVLVAHSAYRINWHMQRLIRHITAMLARFQRLRIFDNILYKIACANFKNSIILLWAHPTVCPAVHFILMLWTSWWSKDKSWHPLLVCF